MCWICLSVFPGGGRAAGVRVRCQGAGAGDRRHCGDRPGRLEEQHRVQRRYVKLQGGNEATERRWKAFAARRRQREETGKAKNGKTQPTCSSKSCVCVHPLTLGGISRFFSSTGLRIKTQKSAWLLGRCMNMNDGCEIVYFTLAHSASSLKILWLSVAASHVGSVTAQQRGFRRKSHINVLNRGRWSAVMSWRWFLRLSCSCERNTLSQKYSWRLVQY